MQLNPQNFHSKKVSNGSGCEAMVFLFEGARDVTTSRDRRSLQSAQPEPGETSPHTVGKPNIKYISLFHTHCFRSKPNKNRKWENHQERCLSRITLISLNLATPLRSLSTILIRFLSSSLSNHTFQAAKRSISE